MAQAHKGMLESSEPEGASREANGGVDGGLAPALGAPSTSENPGNALALNGLGAANKGGTAQKTSGIPSFKEIAESNVGAEVPLPSSPASNKEDKAVSSEPAVSANGKNGHTYVIPSTGKGSSTTGTYVRMSATANTDVVSSGCSGTGNGTSHQGLTLSTQSSSAVEPKTKLGLTSHTSGAGIVHSSAVAAQPGLDAIMSAAESVHNASQRAKKLQIPSATEQPRLPVPTTIEVTQRGTHRPTSHGFRTTEPNHQANSQILAPRAGPLLVPSNTSHTKSSKPTALRRGKWTVEEEAYVARVIQDFNSGFLNAPAGTTLRSYLSEKLHCDPMRITKKFTGDSCIGKRVFHPAVRCPSNAAAIDKAQAELDALERRWRRRLEMQQRESAKKAAASAAAAAAAAACGHSSYQAPPMVAEQQVGGAQMKQVAVTRTASWLDRANAILARQQQASAQSEHPVSGPPQDIQHQMEEMKRLIHEGPIIQQTTAGLTHLVDQGAGSTYPVSTTPTAGNGGRPHSPDTPSRQQQSDKRPKRLPDDTGAADAEALLGFLNSVRAHTEPVASQQGSGN
eukprot:CAMPEP_0194042504 /NCGR_PEP_ID=MMETSP0009_2-20130614/14270_1 /TAXON_ID=210454 /ORGANISM="Grammatophora oceanica, Strain CCMP 410" /LENGTH=566 /DNA_ID=CAMNT_0038686371 /DNA_START=585 /DNA_END=2285 /DNA_ORIENTATION=+